MRARPNLKVWAAIEGKKSNVNTAKSASAASRDFEKALNSRVANYWIENSAYFSSYSITPAMPTSRFIEKNERLVYVCNVMMLCLAQQLSLPLHLEAKAKKKMIEWDDS